MIYRALYLAHLRHLAARREFDIVEAPLWNGEGASIGVAARWPLVIRLETPFELTRQLSGIPLSPDLVALIAAERLQLAYAAGLIGLSRAVLDTVEETYEIPLEAPGRQVTVIPVGMPGAGSLVRRSVEAPHAGGTRYLFVGRLEARKGVLELGQAFARVAAQDPRASLWIIGADNSAHDGFATRTGGNYKRALESLWGKEITSRAHFFGRVADEEKNYLYSECDVLVAPSLYESFGMIFLEAMRYGKPVIGTSVGGVPEVVADGVTGLLVPAEAPERLAEAMLTLGANPTLRREMGAAGLRRFEEQFSLYSLGRQTENFYRQVLDDWHGRASGFAPGLPMEPGADIVPFRPAEGRKVA
ncbi:MAG: glycosyltransferase family 4 protein [Singulisphaera sp.]